MARYKATVDTPHPPGEARLQAGRRSRPRRYAQDARNQAAHLVSGRRVYGATTGFRRRPFEAKGAYWTA